ncbi:MAG: hypothetical protein K6E36_02330 [Oscillospiraceae bacterium]|nr:hypothetical protein [Oscillospiraceae bacterium]
MNRREAYPYYGAIADRFEYGNESDAACIPDAEALIRQTQTETDSEVLEMIFYALMILVTHRKTAKLLDFSPITDHWERFDAMSLDYLPDILAETGDLRHEALLRKIHAKYPQIEITDALRLLSYRAAQP